MERCHKPSVVVRLRQQGGHLGSSHVNVNDIEPAQAL